MDSGCCAVFITMMQSPSIEHLWTNFDMLREGGKHKASISTTDCPLRLWMGQRVQRWVRAREE